MAWSTTVDSALAVNDAFFPRPHLKAEVMVEKEKTWHLNATPDLECAREEWRINV